MFSATRIINFQIKLVATTILRFEKIKNFTAINRSAAHELRFSDTLNADPEKYQLNKVLIGGSNLSKSIKAAFKHFKVKPRKNAVLCMDALLTLSPEAFETVDPERFAEEARAWLLKEYGKGRVVSAVLHLDESTPHIHAKVLPLSKKSNGLVGLNARKLFSPTTLQHYQKSYFQHMQQAFPALVPPRHGSKARHKKIRVFYQELNADLQELKRRELEQIKAARDKTLRKILSRLPALDRWFQKAEEALKQEIGAEALQLLDKYEEYKKNMQFELEEAFDESNEIKNLYEQIEREKEDREYKQKGNVIRRQIKNSSRT